LSRIQRRVRQAGVYFVTSHTWQRRELFRQGKPIDILLDQILDCRDRRFYRLHAFVLMPNHFHLLLTPGQATSLEKAMQMIKGGSAFRIRKELLHRWPIWQPGFHDRWVRDLREYNAFTTYINQNPVKGRLVEKAENYVWCSASGRYRLDESELSELQRLKPIGQHSDVAP
jgi:putative transposase